MNIFYFIYFFLINKGLLIYNKSNFKKKIYIYIYINYNNYQYNKFVYFTNYILILLLSKLIIYIYISSYIFTIELSIIPHFYFIILLH